VFQFKNSTLRTTWSSVFTLDVWNTLREGFCLGWWVRILPWSAVDSTWTAAYDNSTYQRNSESWRLQFRYHPAGDHVQSGAVFYWLWPSRMYVFGEWRHYRLFRHGKHASPLHVSHFSLLRFWGYLLTYTLFGNHEVWVIFFIFDFNTVTTKRRLFC